ncbi:MAG: 4-alpha-glucanotransferase [Chloroflexota bacterium]|nr:4-alpha-glucanotransferase [Chloroflexota bacterium]
MSAGPRGDLLHLARLYGVQTAYYDAYHRRQTAHTEALVAVLKALGAPVETLHDAPEALRERRQEAWRLGTEPVAVAWEGEVTHVELRLPLEQMAGPVACQLQLEGGETLRWALDGSELTTVRAASVEGVPYRAARVALPPALPWGYHRLTMEVPQRQLQAQVVSAPQKAWASIVGADGGVWGVFMPLYSLHSEGSWGSGDLADLEAMMTWVSTLGGSLVATLPLLAAFIDEPGTPSPYMPASRLMWNEFYLDIPGIPELAECPSAREIVASPAFRDEVGALRREPLVDYHRQMALKRRVLEELARCCFHSGHERYRELARFAQAHPAAADYARFRAAGERERAPWPQWPRPLREGTLGPADYDEEARRYHLYVQWLAHRQMEGLAQRAGEQGMGLCLDLPTGVHPHGYDVWRHQDLFIQEASAGAPPDAVFTRGQDWGFAPLHPERLRRQGYGYYVSCLRHHMRHAAVLRIDHVMGLHRLFCIPRGMEASDGVYVRYPAEELYAIIALESYRNRAVVVGEDLGTVPPQVRPAMARHGLHRSYVVQYELCTSPGEALHRVPADAVASMDTHDMPPFAAFWQGLDIQDRREQGLLDEAGALEEQGLRQSQRESLLAFLGERGHVDDAVASAQEAALERALSFLSASPARVVMVNLENTWLETQPQNRPGTGDERPNWRRKARHSLEELRRLPQVASLLRDVDRTRKGRRA